MVELAEDCSREPEDRRNYYLDLAGVECNQSKFQNNSAVPVSGSGLVKTGSSHHRSRSQDTPTAKCDNQTVLNKPDVIAGGHLDKCDNLRRESERHGLKLANGKTDPHLKSKSSDLPEGQTTSTAKVHWQVASSKTNKFRPVSLPGHVPTAVSPHYHRRHRHREKDHDLAMQQVAEWIEREHAWESDRLIVQRHEHHHFHEHHHHHHYHHYHEAWGHHTPDRLTATGCLIQNTFSFPF